MTAADDLIAELRNSLGNRAVSYNSASAAWDVYEGYAFALVLQALEAHVGVRVQGRSGVLHECDVLVLSVAEAELSRSRLVAPRGTRSLIAIECKYYAGHLSLHLARGFHGLHADLGVKNPYFIANLHAQRIQRYLTTLGRNWENGVVPNSREATFFVGQLREAFKKYQSSESWLAL